MLPVAKLPPQTNWLIDFYFFSQGLLVYIWVRQPWFHFACLLSTGFIYQFIIPVLHLRDQQCHLQTQIERWTQRETSVPQEDEKWEGWMSVWGWKPPPLPWNGSTWARTRPYGFRFELKLRNKWIRITIWIFLLVVSERSWLKISLNRLILIHFYSLRQNSRKNNFWDFRGITHSSSSCLLLNLV